MSLILRRRSMLQELGTVTCIRIPAGNAIPTGVLPQANDIMRCVGRFETLDGQTSTLLGARTSQVELGYIAVYSSIQGFVGHYSAMDYCQSQQQKDTNKHTFELSFGGTNHFFSVDGVRVNQKNYHTGYTPKIPPYLGARYYRGAANPFEGSNGAVIVWLYQLERNGEIIENMIPTFQNGEYGMLSTISGVFYTNVGVDPITRGS